MGKKRVVWIELLRIAACFGVVVLHAASQHFRDVPVDTFVWKVSNFYHGISRFAVACFIMISGALYLDKKRTWNLKKLWLKNILSVAVAYVFWQIFYGIYRIVITGNSGRGAVWIVKKMLVYVSDAYFHLWYLPMLIGLMIITPLLWEFVNCKRGKQWEEYLIILFLIFKILPYTAAYFPLPWIDHIKTLMNTVQPDLATDFAGYFILGHYLYEYGLPEKLERLVYVLGVVFIAGGIGLCQWKALEQNSAVQSFYENYTLAAFFWSAAVFLFFRNHIGRIHWSEKKAEIICYLGGCTFGIYLIHAFFRDILHRAGFDSMFINNTVIAVPVVAAVIFVTSLIAVILIRHIPVLKKWIV